MNQGEPQVLTTKSQLGNFPNNLQEGTAMNGTGLTGKPSVEAVNFHAVEERRTCNKDLDLFVLNPNLKKTIINIYIPIKKEREA